MTPERIKAIKARCEAATEGPWTSCEEGGAQIIGNEDMIVVETSNPQMLGCCVKPFNIDFIAHARKDLPDCLAEIERLAAKQCTWSLDVDYGSDDRDYKTGCGRMFSFIEGGPKDNNMNFCCYCGGELIEDNQVRTDAGE